MSQAVTTSAAPLEGARQGLVGFALLGLIDLVAMATLARCFTGPGELAIVLPSCAAVHLLVGGGRRLALRRRQSRGGDIHQGLLHDVAAAAPFAVGLAVGVVLPVVAVDAGTLFAHLSFGHLSHLLNSQLSSAWHIFSNRIAPVRETSGLVLASAWAGGALALAAEVLYSDAGLPAILALVPAFDVVVFTGTLGTTTGRVFELVAIVGLAVAFLAQAQHDRPASRVVVRARVDASSTAATNRRHPLPGAAAGAGGLGAVALFAAIAAGAIGPLLPGATSAPLIAWHGSARGPNGAGGPGRGVPSASVGNASGALSVSSFVSVAEQEIDDPTTPLVTVYSAEPTREVLFTLDTFNGIEWSPPAIKSTASVGVPRFAGRIRSIEQRPPHAVDEPSGSTVIDQAISVDDLTGRWLPMPGEPIGIDGVPGAFQLGTGGPTLDPVNVGHGLVYAVQATLPVPQSSQAADEAVLPSDESSSPDLYLPGPVPAEITALARRITAGVFGPYAMAVKLQDYFLSGAFHYQLPKVAPSGAIANDSQSYRALEAFLFSSKTGYCQQFATAFAVLARVLGLPTRIAIGFLPGREVGTDRYLVTGTDVHAWPEVDFPELGWVTFEPTPGSGGGGTGPSGGPTTTLPPTSVPPSGGATPTTRPRSNLVPARSGGQGGKGPGLVPRTTRVARPNTTSGLGDLLRILLAIALAWAIAVPLLRFVVLQRRRADSGRTIAVGWNAALSVLAVAGAHRRRSETHGEFARRVRKLGILTPEATIALESLATRMDRLTYAPGEPDAAFARAARYESMAVRRAARRRIARWQQLVMLVDPRDLLGRPA